MRLRDTSLEKRTLAVFVLTLETVMHKFYDMSKYDLTQPISKDSLATLIQLRAGVLHEIAETLRKLFAEIDAEIDAEIEESIQEHFKEREI